MYQWTEGPVAGEEGDEVVGDELRDGTRKGRGVEEV